MASIRLNKSQKERAVLIARKHIAEKMKDTEQIKLAIWAYRSLLQMYIDYLEFMNIVTEPDIYSLSKFQKTTKCNKLEIPIKDHYITNLTFKEGVYESSEGSRVFYREYIKDEIEGVTIPDFVFKVFGEIMLSNDKIGIGELRKILDKQEFSTKQMTRDLLKIKMFSSILEDTAECLTSLVCAHDQVILSSNTWAQLEKAWPAATNYKRDILKRQPSHNTRGCYNNSFEDSAEIVKSMGE